MPLQVRVRHALGQRVLELPDREASAPLLIGREHGVEVVIPSVGVSPRHCELFLREGRWTARAVAGVTRLNGKPLLEPAGLNIGDVLSLGSDASPPTLDIEPVAAAEGRSGPAGAGRSPTAKGLRPAAPAYAIPEPILESTPMRGVGKAPPSPAPGWPIAGAAAPSAEPPPPQDLSDAIDWPTDAPVAPAATYVRYYVPRRKRTSGWMIAVGMLFVIAILAGTGIIVNQHLHRPPPARPAAAPIVAEQQPDESPGGRGKLFDLEGDQQRIREQSQDKRSAVAPALRASPTSTPSQNPGKVADPSSAPEDVSASAPAAETSAAADVETAAANDPAFNDVLNAHYDVRRPALAILKLDNYRQLHPGKLVAVLDQYQADALNWIWWQRIDQLWRERDRLTGLLKTKEADLRAQPAGTFHDELVQQKAELEKQRAKVDGILTREMGYTNDLPPDLNSPAKLKALARNRDAEKYSAFRRHILRYVRDNHGALPWAAEP